MINKNSKFFENMSKKKIKISTEWLTLLEYITNSTKKIEENESKILIISSCTLKPNKLDMQSKFVKKRKIEPCSMINTTPQKF